MLSRRSFLALLGFLAAFATAGAYPLPASRELQARAEELRLSLGLSGEAAQVLLIGVDGAGKPDKASLELLARLPVGGVVLFSYNIPELATELARATASLQAAAASGAAARGRDVIPLAIAVDHEGGGVFRFRGQGITRIPPPAEVASKGSVFSRALGEVAGAELRALGVNLALAPVVELLTEDNKRFLGSRSYGRDPATVDAVAGAYIEGLQAGGTAAIAKHFPGNAGQDPHETLPLLAISRALYERDNAPRFSAAIKRGVAGIMLSHVVFPALDPGISATLSKPIVEGELRGSLGFEGLVLTDDLYMKALGRTIPPESSAVAALDAGADLLMLTWKGGAEKVRDAIVKAVNEGRLPRERLAEAARRVIEMKLRFRFAEDLDPELRKERASSYPRLLAEGESILHPSR